MKARPVFWFLLGIALSLIVGSIGTPEAVAVLCFGLVIVALLLLVLAAFDAAERSDGRS